MIFAYDKCLQTKRNYCSIVNTNKTPESVAYSRGFSIPYQKLMFDIYCKTLPSIL